MTKKESNKTVAEKQQASKSVVTKIPENMTAMSDVDLLRSMFSIFSPSGDEHAMIAYVTQYLRDAGIEYEIDTAGNIYFANHVDGNQRILLNAHMDTVGSAAPDILVEFQPEVGTVLRSTNNQVIGGDDKCGVFAVLKTINNKAIDIPLSGLLTVSEETTQWSITATSSVISYSILPLTGTATPTSSHKTVITNCAPMIWTHYLVSGVKHMVSKRATVQYPMSARLYQPLTSTVSTCLPVITMHIQVANM